MAQLVKLTHPAKLTRNPFVALLLPPIWSRFVSQVCFQEIWRGPATATLCLFVVANLPGTADWSALPMAALCRL